MLSVRRQFVFEPLRHRSAYPHEEFGQRCVVRRIVTLQELGRLFLHWRIYPTFGFTETFRPVVAYCLAEKSFFRIVPETKILSQIFVWKRLSIYLLIHHGTPLSYWRVMYIGLIIYRTVRKRSILYIIYLHFSSYNPFLMLMSIIPWVFQ